MIILEGADWSNDWSVFSKPFAPNLVYQFHYYCWDNPANLRDINPYLDSPQEVERPRVGRRDRREQQHDLLGDDAVLREQQHRLVVLAVEEDGRRQWTLFDQEAGRVGRDRRVLSRPRASPRRKLPGRLSTSLLQNVRIENCVYNAEVVNALFHRLPVRVEAENFGHVGLGKSYSVKDPSRKSPNYRKSEPVTIEISEGGGNRQARITPEHPVNG